MVDMEFFITGKKIFDVGFRPALVLLADEVGIKVHATNLRDENKIRVIASGSHQNVTAYHKSIRQNVFDSILSGSTYTPTEMLEYNGPDIDWNGYNTQFMSAQLSKTMSYSYKAFDEINQKLDKIYEKLSEDKTRGY